MNPINYDPPNEFSFSIIDNPYYRHRYNPTTHAATDFTTPSEFGSVVSLDVSELAGCDFLSTTAKGHPASSDTSEPTTEPGQTVVLNRAAQTDGPPAPVDERSTTSASVVLPADDDLGWIGRQDPTLGQCAYLHHMMQEISKESNWSTQTVDSLAPLFLFQPTLPSTSQPDSSSSLLALKGSPVYPAGTLAPAVDSDFTGAGSPSSTLNSTSPPPSSPDSSIDGHHTRVVDKSAFRFHPYGRPRAVQGEMEPWSYRTSDTPRSSPSDDGLCQCPAAAKQKRHWDTACPQNPNKVVLPCSECEKTFTRLDNLKRHITRKHSSNSPESFV